MGKAPEPLGIGSGPVRYVSPVTVRLFSKLGSTAHQALGLSNGEVLAPLSGTAAASSGSDNTSSSTGLEAESGNSGEGEGWPRQPAPRPHGMAGSADAAPPPRADASEDEGGGESSGGAGVAGGVGVGTGLREHRVEVVRPYSTSPVNGAAATATCPQTYLESILSERGYDRTIRSSASMGCCCEPTQKQMQDYQVPLVEAVRRWDMETLEQLARAGVDMGASNRFGESVVHLATRRGSAPVLQFLLAHGGSLHICDDYGKTPLHDAFWSGEPRFDLVAMMLDSDWRLLRAADVRGATPLRYAKKRHWGLWCEFLDRVKDKHWPFQGSGAVGGGEY